ncbi:hypothetical protein N665_0105s0022 [Sinapis alba]|nr:hypothetical protein N665_0105s0022 [Sinapis alba]
MCRPTLHARSKLSLIGVLLSRLREMRPWHSIWAAKCYITAQYRDIIKAISDKWAAKGREATAEISALGGCGEPQSFGISPPLRD